MKTATIDELVSHPEEMFQGDEAVMVTKNGRPIGVIQPLPDPRDLPIEVRRRLYAESSEAVARELRAKGITEEQVDRDIESLLQKSRGRH